MDKGSIFILSYFKTLNIGPVPENEPVLQSSALTTELIPPCRSKRNTSIHLPRISCQLACLSQSLLLRSEWRQRKTTLKKWLWPQHDCSLFPVISFSQIEIKIFPFYAIWPPDVRDIVSSSQYRLTLVGAHCASFCGQKIRRGGGGECEERPPPFPPPQSTQTLFWEHRFNRGFKIGIYTYTVNTWSSDSE